ncbi:MAG: hypothetical protein Kow0029_14170 [Candidatus Rifleibacteriota bacterium]
MDFNEFKKIITVVCCNIPMQKSLQCKLRVGLLDKLMSTKYYADTLVSPFCEGAYEQNKSF